MLTEFRVVRAQSDLALRRQLADLDAPIGLPAKLKELLRDLADHWKQLRLPYHFAPNHAELGNQTAQKNGNEAIAEIAGTSVVDGVGAQARTHEWNIRIVSADKGLVVQWPFKH